jgi:hypothetical protein
MGLPGAVAALVIGLVAAAGPTARLASDQRLEPVYDRGLARSERVWVVSGRNTLARVDDGGVPERRVDAAIPEAWAQLGFDHIGDVDVSGTTPTCRSSSQR